MSKISWFSGIILIFMLPLTVYAGNNSLTVNFKGYSSGFSIYRIADNELNNTEDFNELELNYSEIKTARDMSEAAEAAVMNNDNPNALYYINEVRKRARNNAPESDLSLYTGTVTLDDILDERALELFGESPRWNDLQRTGKLAERVLKYNWDVTNITGGLVQTQLSENSFVNKYKWRPIPLTWLNTLSNGKELGNNPGW